MKKMDLNSNSFEDRDTDWLAQERKYESCISAWDIDDPKTRHSMSTDAHMLKTNHSDKHDAVRESYTSSAQSRVAGNRSVTRSRVMGVIVALIAYLIIFMFIVSTIIGFFI